MAKRPFWHYSGDRNLECGGYFYNLDSVEYGYVDVVRVQPCSDAGAQDNAWWIEMLTVNLPEKSETVAEILRHVGYGDEYAKADKRTKLHMLVDACVSHGAYDKEDGETVQIGPVAEWCSRRELVYPDKTLRGNCTLARYVRKEYLR